MESCDDKKGTSLSQLASSPVPQHGEKFSSGVSFIFQVNMMLLRPGFRWKGGQLSGVAFCVKQLPQCWDSRYDDSCCPHPMSSNPRLTSVWAKMSTECPLRDCPLLHIILGTFMLRLPLIPLFVLVSS